MKKLLVGCIVLSLVLLIGGLTRAEAQVSVGYLSGGSCDDGYATDLSAWVLGAGYQADAYMVDGNIFLTSNSSTDFELRGGWQFWGDDVSQLYLTAEYSRMTVDYQGSNETTGGYLLGLDYRHNFNDSWALELALAYSVTAAVDFESSPDQDAFMRIFRSKFEYSFSDSLGLFLGYRYDQYKDTDGAGYPINWTGFSLGLSVEL